MYINSDFYEVVWFEMIDRLYYLLFVGDQLVENGYYINDDVMLLIMDVFFDVVDGYEDFFRLERDLGSVVVGSSEDVKVYFNVVDLNGGMYEVSFLIQNSDFFNFFIVIFVNLYVSGVVDIQVSCDMLEFGLLFVGVEKVDFLIIYNIGFDLLGVSFIVFGNVVFQVDVSLFGV